MDKWIPPALILIIIVIVIWPYFALILAIFLLLLILSVSYFNFKTPPPYMSITKDLDMVINWFTKSNHKTAIVIKGKMKDSDQVSHTFFPKSSIKNEYTGKFTVHSEIIENLVDYQKYYYEIVKMNSNGQTKIFGGKNYWFVKPGKDLTQNKLKIAVLGDLQPRRDLPPLTQLLIFRKIKKNPPDLLFFLGDHTNQGIHPEGWRHFYHIVGTIGKHTPILGVPGNHDTGLKREGGIRDVVPAYNTYVNYPEPKNRYFVNFYGINLFAFDFNTGFSEGTENHTLFNQNIQNINKNNWTIVLWHSSPHNTLKFSQQIDDLRKNYVPVLNELGPNLWFGGHEHSYQRFTVDGTHFITSAATSSFHKHRSNFEHMEKLVMKYHYVMLTVDVSQIKVDAIPLKGEKIDELTISK